MEKVLITGASGFIGKNLVIEFLNYLDEHKTPFHRVQLLLSCSPRSELSISDPRICFVQEPIFSNDKDLFKRLGSPTSCIHLAWKDGFNHRSVEHMQNLSSHEKFCRTMMESGLKRLAVLGTMHEVGYWQGAIDEKTPCSPITQYGIAKNALRASLLLTAKETKCNFHWLRAFYITGDEERGNNIFSKLLEASKKGQEVFPFTTGKNKYDFINVKELARMIINCTYDNSSDRIINICSGKPVSLAEKVESFITDKGLPIKLGYGLYPDRKYDSPAIWGDSTIIERIMENTSISF